MLRIIADLRDIHSALDDGFGDTDLIHVEDDDELRGSAPVQWAAQKVSALIERLEKQGGES